MEKALINKNKENSQYLDKQDSGYPMKKSTCKKEGCLFYCQKECPAKQALEQALRLIDYCPYICGSCEKI